jgi:regulator of replication initiation timing
VFVSSDNDGLKQYKMKKKQAKRVDEISSDINSLKSELTEIKEALKFLIEKN